jgi:hypothetical protein|eukprot:COSAG06_NODE_4941_length_3843_cov_7.925481_3_plen_61_part_00
MYTVQYLISIGFPTPIDSSRGRAQPVPGIGVAWLQLRPAHHNHDRITHNDRRHTEESITM